MPGIASVLNIAKEALLTHQSAIGVAGHNVANVSTPGYSRQELRIGTPVASPDASGYYGNGVRAEEISRKYDEFITQRLSDQNSSIKNLESLEQSLEVVGTIFNEAPGLAVNDLLSKFWTSWQDLSNNPELSSSRQTVVQQAELLNNQFHVMNDEIINVRSDLNVKLKESISSFNSLAAQIADINGQITGTESARQQQNDLRDSRDELMKELSTLADISYFETSSGAYTVMLADGNSIVEVTQNNAIELSNNKMYKVAISSEGETRSQLNESVPLGGQIGALMEVNDQLAEGDPNNYLGKLNSLVNAMIREVNQQHAQGVGTVLFSETLSGSEMAENTTLLHTTVDSATASDTLAAGTFTINGREVGRIDGSIISYGQVKGKAYNTVQAINDAYAGVTAKLTTQVAGEGITNGLSATEVVNFTVNGIPVSYTAAANETAAETAANVANAINSAIFDYDNNVGLTPPQQNIPTQMTIDAFVGNGLNGGAVNSIILKNTYEGDDSKIIIEGLEEDPSQATYAIESKLGLANGTFEADATNNSGEISVFTNEDPIVIEGGPDDRYLAHLGWSSAISYSDNAAIDEPAGGSASYNITFDINNTTITVPVNDGDNAATLALAAVDAINLSKGLTGVEAAVGDGTNGGVTNSIVFFSRSNDIVVENYTVPVGETDVLGFNNFVKRGVAAADEEAGDGLLQFEFQDNGVINSMMGFDYANEIETEGTSFKLWIYNSDDSLAISQPVSVPMDRVYTLQDVVDAVNIAVTNAIDDPSVTTPWVSASIYDNKLSITADDKHKFAFGGDDSNFLASAGINTLLTGHSADTIEVNSVISENLDNLAAGTINEFGEFFTGDNSNALTMTNIQRSESISFYGGSTDSLDGHYNTLVASIGLQAKAVSTDLEFNLQVNDQLNQLRDSTSGVSLDEEMANLIKFQHAYSAAAKLVSTSDEMLQTLLNSI